MTSAEPVLSPSTGLGGETTAVGFTGPCVDPTAVVAPPGWTLHIGDVFYSDTDTTVTVTPGLTNGDIRYYMHGGSWYQYDHERHALRRWATSPPELTEEERHRQRLQAELRERERHARQMAYEQRQRLERERRNAAEARAKALLERLLNAEQRKTLAEHDYFDVVGSLGNRYRIRCSGEYQGNVRWIDDDGNQLGELCGHPDMESLDDDHNTVGYMPTSDAYIGQMLLITTDEDRFLTVANLHRGRRPERLGPSRPPPPHSPGIRTIVDREGRRMYDVAAIGEYHEVDRPRLGARAAMQMHDEVAVWNELGAGQQVREAATAGVDIGVGNPITAEDLVGASIVAADDGGRGATG